MILRVPRDFPFPLAIAAFIGVTISYADLLFTPTTRWFFLAVLTVYLLARGRFMFGFQSWFGVALIVYCGWCLMTTLWSQVPELSLYKAVALVLVAVTFVSAGDSWAFDKGLNAMSCFAPIVAMALFAGVFGAGESGSILQGESVELYEGLTGNPNMLGSLIAMASPLLLWNAYRYRKTPQMKWIWFGLLAAALLLLLRTHARASFLAVGMVMMLFFLSFKLRKINFGLVLVAAALLFAVAVGTNFLDAAYNNYVLKGMTHEYIEQYSQGTQEGGILYTRNDVWRQSYENAEQGGWFGAGYGVSIGATQFAGGLNAISYGREKANSQLGIVEETGIVGLMLYFIVLTALFARLVPAFIREGHGERKTALGLVTGSLAGFLVMSVFEAWWGSPGSPESAYFWSLTGIALGSTHRPILAAAPLARRPIATPTIVASQGFPPQQSAKGG